MEAMTYLYISEKIISNGNIWSGEINGVVNGPSFMLQLIWLESGSLSAHVNALMLCDSLKTQDTVFDGQALHQVQTFLL